MSKEATISLRIDMLSDWSIGTGTGRQGSLDSIVERDADGFPVITATSFKGMWRDATETVAHGLDEGVSADWTRIVRQLFGSQPEIDNSKEPPIRSRLAVADARVPEALRCFVNDNGKLRFRDAMFFVRPGVKIDRQTGSAEQDMLRFDEVARAGSVLETKARLALSGDQAFDKALLAVSLASLSLIERIGGDRRRGRGACKVSVTALEAGETGRALSPSGNAASILPDAIAWLEKTDKPAAMPAMAPEAEDIRFATARDGGFKRYALWVELLSPTCVAQEVQGNIITTNRAIPGSVLLGAVFPALLQATGLSAADLRTMAANGDLRILDAAPAIGDQRSAPAPLIFEAKKEKPSDIRNKVFGAEAKEQHKPMRGVMVVPGSATLFEAPKIGTVLRTHNAVDDEIQKPTEDAGGGVFVLEAMEPGTRLLSEIWLRGAELRSPIDRQASVGRAKNAGYGRIRLHAEPVVLTAAALKASARDKALIWVRSDIVLPPGCATAAEAIAVLLTPYGLERAPLNAASEIRMGRHDGWVAAWGLPRPTIATISAGSVIILDDVSDQENLERLALDGLGDRRSEGFGAVSVNDDILFAEALELQKFARSPDKDGKAKVQKLTLDQGTKSLQTTIAAIERVAIETLIAEKAEISAGAFRAALKWGVDASGEPRPNMSQIGRLREVMGDCREPGRRAALAMLEAVAGNDARLKKWGGMDVINRTKAMFTSPNEDLVQFWKKLSISDDEWNSALVTRTRDEALAEFWPIALLSVLRVLMRNHKRKMEREAA